MDGNSKPQMDPPSGPQEESILPEAGFGALAPELREDMALGLEVTKGG